MIDFKDDLVQDSLGLDQRLPRAAVQQERHCEDGLECVALSPPVGLAYASSGARTVRSG